MGICQSAVENSAFHSVVSPILKERRPPRPAFLSWSNGSASNRQKFSGTSRRDRSFRIVSRPARPRCDNPGRSPGKRFAMQSLALKGRDTLAVFDLRPYRATELGASHTQGCALGYHIAVLQTAARGLRSPRVRKCRRCSPSTFFRIALSLPALPSALGACRLHCLSSALLATSRSSLRAARPMPGGQIFSGNRAVRSANVNA